MKFQNLNFLIFPTNVMHYLLNAHYLLVNKVYEIFFMKNMLKFD